eukprot:3832407-Lingulodinium_polyedra.AAC.1
MFSGRGGRGSRATRIEGTSFATRSRAACHVATVAVSGSTSSKIPRTFCLPATDGRQPREEGLRGCASPARRTGGPRV